MFFTRKKKNDEERDRRFNYMSEDEIRMVDDFITKIELNRGYMDEFYTRWEEEQIAYAGDQELKDSRPNTRVNIINSNIEGQVSALVDQNIDISCSGEDPGDQQFARRAEVALDFILRKNHIKRKIKRHEMRRELFGPAWFKVYYDYEALNGFGLATIVCPPLNSVFVDMKITDEENLQDAEYIAEVMPRSKQWAIEKYGEVAQNIIAGSADRSSIWTKERTEDDENLYWHIQLWTKTDGILRLLEFSDDGALLEDSFKEWTGEKFKEVRDPQPYYRYNKYPYFLTNLYFDEGKLFGFGDGKLLRPLQDMVNDLYDQIRRSARPNRIFFDPDSEVELEDLDMDDGPVPCRDPNSTIRVIEAGRVNEALWRLLANIHLEIQRVVRFSDIMLGQRASTQTATEAAIQQQQSGSGIDHKKLMLQETLIDVCRCALDLHIEHAQEGHWFKTDEDRDEYEFIDFRQFDRAPVMVPPTDAYTRSFLDNNPGAELPKWMQLHDEDGTPMSKSVDLDVKINIGAGLPKNKAFLYQMMEKLSGMVVENKHVITWKEMRKFVENFLGLPLMDADEIIAEQMAQAQEVNQQAPEGLMQGADVGGLSDTGRPMMSVLPGGGGGIGPVG